MNADFIRGFISAIIPPAERPDLIDARGNLTQTGLRRIPLERHRLRKLQPTTANASGSEPSAPYPAATALKLYRKLRKIEKDTGKLSPQQAQTLERAERALGQLFMFEDVRRQPDFRLESDSTFQPPSGLNAEQLTLFKSAVRSTASPEEIAELATNLRHLGAADGHVRRLDSRDTQGLTVLRMYGPARRRVIRKVWDMLEMSYRAIGVPYKRADHLLADGPTTAFWDVVMHQGIPVAYSILKVTPWGYKTVSRGQDGSEAGKAAWKSYFERLTKNGFYAELSGAPAKIALKRDFPRVPVQQVQNILGKTVSRR